MYSTDIELCDWPSFEQDFSSPAKHISHFKKAIATANDVLADRFWRDYPVIELVKQRAWLIDQLLIKAWKHFIHGDGGDIALIAVGGYGRGELHPASDIDLLILLADAETKQYNEAIEKFVLFLWDIGLDVGHSVRCMSECVAQANSDITIATNLLESRLIDGPKTLFDDMQSQTGPDRIWPGRDFFQAKLEEQIARHHRFGDTSYNLEPNIKENPGGLRDIQTIGWVAKRHFDADTFHNLVEHGFITEHEYEILEKSQAFLWKIRFGLHIIAKRKEDRLLFDYQRTLANKFGYQDSEHRLGVEHFMRDYYHTVMELNRLNEMLLQLFDEVILFEGDKNKINTINRRFQEHYGFIEVTHPGIFKRYPFALLEIFLILAQHPELRGVRAETIRLIRDHRYLIDNDFRKDLRCQSLFMELFRQPRGLTHELRRMHRYGVLGKYLPMFGNIEGLMQHDLFHVYTVDQHTLFLVRNLRRFMVAQFSHELPLCSNIIKTVPKPELLYLAGLFHDIAKGRGGDHSELGAQDAMEFCQHHGLSNFDANIVAWLVKNHLIMSTTAQRKDISDADVINEFAENVGSQERLNYLYLLTVADIRATNSTLWNSWKDSLLAELYYATTRTFRRGLRNPAAEIDRHKETQAAVLEQLKNDDFTEDEIHTYWNSLESDYITRYSVDEIVWHIRSILTTPADRLPIVLVREQTHRGGTELFVYAEQDNHVFAIITSILERQGLTITDARITSSNHGYTLYTFIVLESNGEVISNQYRIKDIIETLQEFLPKADLAQLYANQPKQPLPRQLKHFPIPTEVLFRDDSRNKRTILEVVARDQPGLLAKIALALVKCKVKVHNAKIATFGERAEDIFFITDLSQQPLAQEEQFENLRKTITQLLEG
ncbi:[protein-PII] uridylyltransferase [Kaarinaea lacus]